jgi:hypothetical protein
MKITLACAILSLCASALSQSMESAILPETPQPSHIRRVYVPSTPLGWHETFTSKTFWSTHSVYALSIAADEYVTLRGESHGCLEHGDAGGYHVSFGRMGAVDWSEFGGITLLDLALRKVNIKIAPYSTPLIAAAKHGLGVYHWTQTGCL